MIHFVLYNVGRKINKISYNLLHAKTKHLPEVLKRPRGQRNRQGRTPIPQKGPYSTPGSMATAQ